jgi:hypothetical protein
MSKLALTIAHASATGDKRNVAPLRKRSFFDWAIVVRLAEIHASASSSHARLSPLFAADVRIL